MKRGFTLIELLIVIGILAILATTVTLVLNPGEILKQTRDVQRISDLRSVKSAIDLYLATSNVSPLTLFYGNSESTSYCETGDTEFPTWRASINNLGKYKRPFLNSLNSNDNSENMANPRDINGGGWVPVNFSNINIGSPLAKLPLDPVNSAPSNGFLATPNNYSLNQIEAYYYAYLCSGLTYEINANMESTKYSYGGLRDAESTDGGTKAQFRNGLFSNFCVDPINDSPGEPCYDASAPSTYIADRIYEIGNDPGLDL